MLGAGVRGRLGIGGGFGDRTADQDDLRLRTGLGQCVEEARRELEADLPGPFVIFPFALVEGAVRPSRGDVKNLVEGRVVEKRVERFGLALGLGEIGRDRREIRAELFSELFEGLGFACEAGDLRVKARDFGELSTKASGCTQYSGSHRRKFALSAVFAQYDLMPVIRFVKNIAPLEVESGAVLMDALLAAGLPVASSCHGDGVCAKCRVVVLEGAENLSGVGPVEQMLRDRLKIPKGVRISCQTKVVGDVLIDTSYW
jgi:ferredoxin, 2Fe-2S